MASSRSSTIDPRSGFCAETKTFRSLRPDVPLPSETLPLSFTSYALSLLPTPLPSHPALIDAATSASISYPTFISHLTSLSSNLKTLHNLSKGQIAFILSPPHLHVPILYFSLLSLGVVISPSNPTSSPSELSRHISLVSPSIAFATSTTAHLLPPHMIPTVILLDSPHFLSLLHTAPNRPHPDAVEVRQSDTAAIQFSSGTTGRVKAAALTHRSFIAMVAGFHAEERRTEERCLLIAPMFHSFGFFYGLKGLALGETTVFGRMAGFEMMMRAAERHRVTTIAAAPPVVVAMARGEKVGRYDLGALETVACGGAPLSVEAGVRFMERFPRVQLRQGYGSTEGGGISRMIGHEECRHIKSTGRLSENVEAKIVDIVSGSLLSVGQPGELWLRGPAIMKGYVGDEDANVASFDSEGWLRTGDLCYFDSNGYLYIVDRLKELIKYKAYQVPPIELEHILHTLPDIVDAAVIPYPLEEVGEIPMAFVVRKSGSNLNEQEVMDYVAEQVAPYKKIRKVAFVNSIPKSAAGKILRRVLADHALSTMSKL